jgi:16S rRNA G1207 methylase RsmC
MHHVLDVGAGSGALSIALLQKYPHLKATLMDIPSVCNIASQYLLQYGVHQRSNVVDFDMFSKIKPYPTGHDAILFSQILHDWNFEQGRFLLQKAYDALQDGGKVVIHEKLTNPHQNHTPVFEIIHRELL